MTLPRSAADVLTGHVLFEIEAIDRMYLNLYQPRLQHGARIAAFFVGHQGLSHLPELKEIGFTASRRLLDVQRISHDPADGVAALNNPVITAAGTRTAGMRITDPRTQAPLAALCVFRLLPNGFTNRDLRTCLAPLLGLDPGAMTSGQISYDLWRLRIHGLINRIPHSFATACPPHPASSAGTLSSPRYGRHNPGRAAGTGDARRSSRAASR